jgi:predicted CopG family antitoxin
MDKKDLLRLKDEIDEARTTVAELTGKKKSLLLQLKETYNCNTLEEAEKKVLEMTKQIEKMDLQIQNGLDELEEKMENNDQDN